MEYSDRIDAQIAELLSTRTRLTPAHLPGIPDDEGAALLRHYAELHGADEHVTWDGGRLVRERPAASQAPATIDDRSAAPTPGPSAATIGSTHDEAPKKASPVEEILAAPAEKSLLDSAPSGAVPRWLWILPVLFAFPGGLVAWMLARGTNRTIARTMLVVGIVMTLLSVWAGSALQSANQRMGSIIEQSR